jgi:hypothetical protein
VFLSRPDISSVVEPRADVSRQLFSLRSVLFWITLFLVLVNSAGSPWHPFCACWMMCLVTETVLLILYCTVKGSKGQLSIQVLIIRAVRLLILSLLCSITALRIIYSTQSYSDENTPLLGFGYNITTINDEESDPEQSNLYEDFKVCPRSISKL